MTRRRTTKVRWSCIAALTAIALGDAAPAPARQNVAATPDDPAAYQAPAIAADPVRPRHLAIAYDEGTRLETCYVALSLDGGRSWRTEALVGRGARFPLDTEAVCWKPMLAYGPDGALYYVFTTALNTYNGERPVMLVRSPDGGRTWERPRAVFPQDDIAQVRPSLAVDQRSGRVYVAWTNLLPDPAGPRTTVRWTGPLQVTSSGDGGRTFASPVEPNLLHRVEVCASLLAVGSDQRLYIAYSMLSLYPNRSNYAFRLVTGSSRDGGRTFRTQPPEDMHPHGYPNSDVWGTGLFRVFTIAAGREPGRVYVAWWRKAAANGPSLRGGSEGPPASTAEPDRLRIVFSTSADHGETWSERREVGVPAGGERRSQHRPWLTVAVDGSLDLVYYDRDGADGAQHVYATRSHDRGTSFTPPERLTDVPSDPRVGPASEEVGGPTSFGDFLGATRTDEGLVAAWTDSRRGTRLTGKQDVYVSAPDNAVPRRSPSRRLRVSVIPARAYVGRRTRFRLAVRSSTRNAPVAGVLLRLGGRQARTGRDGQATITTTFRQRGRRSVAASKRGFVSARRRIEVVQSRGSQ